MRIVASILACLFVLAPLAAYADTEPAITRHDGFLLVWESVRRAVTDNREKSFADVPDAMAGSAEITYAKYRGILDPSAGSGQAQTFRPNDPLALQDAVLWLFRTRSVDDIAKLIPENLPGLLMRYPIANLQGHAADTVTKDQLMTLMQSLDALLTKEVHEVSLYAEDFNGKGTAFGEIFNMNALTAAHRTYPYNTLVRVTNIENGKSVVVRVNDRGPYVAGRDMDLSLAAFTAIAERSKGKINATFQRLGDATLVSGCEDPRTQVRIVRDVRFVRGVPHTFGLGQTLTLRANKAFVVRGIGYPDGTFVRQQDFITGDEVFSFTPAITGDYSFLFGTIDGRIREMRMTVSECGK